MRLASLYSGGKDSAFSMYLAEQMGHHVPYLVNIRPEGDSWMFHVPNQDMVPLLAESMGKRLVSVPTDGSEQGDMDSLRLALRDLDAEGVVTGAVWSDYQWERINAVCDELGLAVLSPMWRKDQDMILDEILDSGILAMVVGVYADGMDASWLGRMLDAAAAEDLRRAREVYGISVLGEGGEYETLTLCSPMQSSRLVPESCEREWRNSSGTLTVTSARLESL